MGSSIIEGVIIGIGSTVEDAIDCIEEADYFEAASCAFGGMDYIYTYNDCTITFTDDDDVAIAYTKDQSKLQFIISDDQVISILIQKID